ncbi:MAG TPA: hypothetical protein VD864_01010 [Nocardioides sp.]|nr:hypothetical protein [Nocardioides sp.]
MPSVRTAVVEQIITRLADRLGESVKIDPGLPGKTIHREHVFVPVVTGTRSFPYSKGSDGHFDIDDEFTVTFVFSVAWKGRTSFEAGARVEELSDALLEVLATDPGLADDIPELIDIKPGTFDGPELENTNEGVIAFIRADVEVHARYVTP